MKPVWVRVILLHVVLFCALPAGGTLASGGDRGPREFEFEGTVESLPSSLVGDWRVSGLIVHVTSATRIEQEDGPARVGAFVEVKGTLRTDGSVDATKIEVERGAGPGDQGEIEFKGTIESLPGTLGFVGDWRVGGRAVHVTAATQIEQEDGPVAVGAFVEVEGTRRTDGSVDATEIEVERGAGPGDQGEIEFKGTIESLPGTVGFVGDWRVGGRTVHVTAATRIEQEDGPVAVGAFVEVEGTAQPDGSLTAAKIEVKSNVAGGDGRDELTGKIESLPPEARLVGDWTVAGRIVHVSASTLIDQEHGSVAVGATVEVKGTRRPDGSLDAARIEVKAGAGSGQPDDGSRGSAGFKGSVESLPAAGLVGDWTVSGRTVHVTSSTRINQEHGPVRIGTRVKVKGIQLTDGTTVATKIQVRD